MPKRAYLLRSDVLFYCFIRSFSDASRAFKSINAIALEYGVHPVPVGRRKREILAHAGTLFKGMRRPKPRERDSHDLFCLAQQIGTHFLCRTSVDRLAGDGGHKVAGKLGAVRIHGLHQVEVCNRCGNLSPAVLAWRLKRIGLLSPIGKRATSPARTLTMLQATARGNAQWTPSYRLDIAHRPACAVLHAGH